ncbi:MAG: hypothetical protein QOD26_1385 [Betaproteobacteria bacterium]|jgi:hypothetical protein|nr:hypothetical protein [Betaproteobacteria bacterium]
MKITTIVVTAFSLALLAACDRGDQRPAASGSSAAPRNEAAQPTTPPSSANSGKTERTPVQGQVDPKEGAQHRDFKTNGK